ncbi:MFS transporter [Hypericibacter adhaerens]|uniref:MFS transporter n=1 Tax=Hypericibacter adhaerens TaxID=2602016 RepID=A0A5J6MU19_9PROT|nr:MFS transporter [Hypericibacter adhaerens]QEX20771.1 MFS transporter [Hypericibacter adhaerens]
MPTDIPSGTGPMWLRAVSRPGAIVFAIMFTLESFARGLIATIIPLQAYALLQHARDVSILYTAVGLVGLASSFGIPFLIRRFKRRWVYTAGAAALLVAALLLATATLTGQIGAMLARAFGAAALNITLSLYVMDYIRRKDLVRSEPIRLMVSAAAWTIGPAFGVWLYSEVGHGVAELLSAASCALLLLYFWYLRLTENPAVAAATRPPPNPIATIRRFVAQPRLRLGWFVPFARSCWWAMYFVYPPLFLVQAGKGDFAGALLVSLGNAMLFVTPLFSRMAARSGIRRPIIVGFIGLGVLTTAAGFMHGWPWIAAGTLLAGSAFCCLLDAFGNIPYMRAVRPLERPQMTTVFRTYIDLSDLMPQAFYSVLLSFFDIRAVFIACGLFMFVAAAVALKIPKRM